MQKREYADSDLPGVCHRFFNWVLTRFLRFRRQSSSPRLPPVSSTEVPVEHVNNKGGDDKRTAAGGTDQAQLAVPLQKEPPAETTVASGEKSGEQLKAGKVRRARTTDHQEVKQEIIRPWPGLTLVTNINEISDDYIRERKAAMQRTNTTNPPPTGVF